MEPARILDASIIKDLSNHIYEKRKATAFQIETLTKSALERNDSQVIYSIISELKELTNGPTNSARIGAITALGSVSVALGPFAIAYYLDDIITPIFSSFKDTDARVRYYACESLYNISKVARGEILLYFNEVFDVLCVLVTDPESSVKNAADILDRLIKDIVSAKATNYVSILHEDGDKRQENPPIDIAEDNPDPQAKNGILSHVVDSTGTAIQVNQIQDTQKAFSLPKFIPTLLERMYITDPFAKKFLISWLELFDNIPSLELITFLPNFLEPLINFLRNGAPSDVRIETQNILNAFLKEVKAIQKVKNEVKRRQLENERKLKQQTKDKADQSNDEEASISSAVDESEISEIKDLTINDGPQQSSELEEEFLEGQNIFIDYQKIIAILLSFLKPEKQDKQDRSYDLSGDGHDVSLEVKFIVLRWLQDLIQFSPISFTKYFPDCVSITIQKVSSADNNKDFELRNQFLKFNLAIQSFFIKLNEENTKPEDLDGSVELSENLILGLNKDIYDEVIEFQLTRTIHNIMRECLTCMNELARITSLDWLIFLYSKEPSSFVNLGDGTEDGGSFDLLALLQSATDSSNEVISKVLQLLSKISETNQDFFKDFMVKLINFFQREVDDSLSNGNVSGTTPNAVPQALSRTKVEFIIRKLCVTLDSEKIFKTISEVLTSLEDGNLEFLNMIVVTLNNILLTTTELTSFRKKLKNLDVYKLEDWSLFATLFESWCHNPASALSICLLTANYDLAFLIIKSLSESEITYQLLAQLDILVQLLESPIFLKLRLQLLEPEKNPYLYKTLYGLLMILPQSSTYTTLHNRLSSISGLNHINYPNNSITTPVSTPGVPGANSSTGGSTGPSSLTQQLSVKRKRVYEMVDRFNRVQESHEGHQLTRKLRESTTSSLNNDESFSRGKPIDSIQSKSDRLLSYGERKEYSNTDTEKKKNRFSLNRFG